jgi:hypothetical protein
MDLSEAIKVCPAAEIEAAIAEAVGRVLDRTVECRISILDFDYGINAVHTSLVLSDPLDFDTPDPTE